MSEISSKRVAHLFGELLPSGAEMMLETGAPYLISGAWAHTIVSTGQRLGVFTERLRSAGFDIAHLPFSRALGTFLTFRRWLKAGKFDVVHIHRESGYFYYALAALLAGCHVVRTFHNEFRFAGALRWRRLLQRRFLDWLGVLPNACSPAVARSERDTYGLDPSIVNCWYDERRFRPIPRTSSLRQDLGIDQSTVLIASVGNCNAFKNHAMLLRALARIPNSPIAYLHCGIESSEHPEREMSADLGLAGKVHFLGPVTKVEEVLAECDAYVLPSTREGFPVSAVEGAAMGIDCILTRVGITPHLEGLPRVRLVSCELEMASALEALSARGAVPPSQELSDAIAARFGAARQAPKYLLLYDAALRRDQRFKTPL